MSKEWQALAEQIADLKRQVAEITAERDHYKTLFQIQQLVLSPPGDPNVH